MAEDRSESPFSQPGDQVQLLLGRTELLLQKQRNSPRQRLVVALAGVPGSGKSTVAAALLKSLQDRGEQDVAILSMDGFHHTKEALSRFDCPVTAFSRRGAPFTFDGEKFATFMETVKSSEVTLEEDPELALRAPSFDHAIQDPVAKDVYISSKCKLVIVEGNYVLLDLAPWSRVAELANETQVWFANIDPAAARKRLIARHLRAGIEVSEEAAAARVEENDMNNAVFILQNMRKPDVSIAA